MSKIRTVLLGEIHEDVSCTVDNIQLISELMKSYGEKTPRFMVVSEGRGLNTCYQIMRIQPERIINEFDDSHAESKVNDIDKFLLIAELMQGYSKDDIRPNQIPASVVLDEEFFQNRARFDGFSNMLSNIENGMDIYQHMIQSTLTRNADEFDMFFVELLQKIVNSSFLDGELKDVKTMIRAYLIHRDHRFIKGIFYGLRNIRDINMIKKIERRVQSVQSSYRPELIIIIFGAAHYPNLRKLIKNSIVLKFDESKSKNISGHREYLPIAQQQYNIHIKRKTLSGGKKRNKKLNRKTKKTKR
jgi:uncharacterized protein YihD (DUF1040 family)